MLIIESIGKRRNFIAGISDTKTKAEDFWSLIQDKENFRLSEIKEIEFPIYIVESLNQFEYLNSVDRILQKIKSIEVLNPDDGEAVYFNLYKVDQEFLPENPGIDRMGILPHIHIDNEHLTEILKNDLIPF